MKRPNSARNHREQGLVYLERLAHGITVSAIARDTGKNEVEIELQLVNITGKLGARNRTHAITLAFRSGEISLDPAK